MNVFIHRSNAHNPDLALTNRNYYSINQPSIVKDKKDTVGLS